MLRPSRITFIWLIPTYSICVVSSYMDISYSPRPHSTALKTSPFTQIYWIILCDVRHLKNVGDVGICPCMWVNVMSVVFLLGLRTPFLRWRNLIWCCYRRSSTGKRKVPKRAVRRQNKKKKTWVSHLFVFMTSLYTYTISVSVATESFGWAELVHLLNCAGYR